MIDKEASWLKGSPTPGPLHFSSHLGLAAVLLTRNAQNQGQPETWAPSLCFDVVKADVLAHFSGPQYLSSIRLSQKLPEKGEKGQLTQERHLSSPKPQTPVKCKNIGKKQNNTKSKPKPKSEQQPEEPLAVPTFPAGTSEGNLRYIKKLQFSLRVNLKSVSGLLKIYVVIRQVCAIQGTIQSPSSNKGLHYNPFLKTYISMAPEPTKFHFPQAIECLQPFCQGLECSAYIQNTMLYTFLK